MSILLALDQGSVTTANDIGNVSQLTFNLTTTNDSEFIFVDVTCASTIELSVQSVSDNAHGPYAIRYILGPFTMLQPPMFDLYLARFYTPTAVGARTVSVTATLDSVPTNGFAVQAYAYVGTNQINPFDPSGSLPIFNSNPANMLTTPTVSGVSTVAQANDVLLWHFATKTDQINNQPLQGNWTNIATNRLGVVAFEAETDQLPTPYQIQSATYSSTPVSGGWVAVVDALTDPPLYLAYGLGAKRRM